MDRSGVCPYVRFSDPMNTQPSPIILALDTDSAENARQLATLLKDDIAMVKVGLQLFAAEGPEFVKELTENGVRVFLDLKLHDIPNTVAGAAVEAARMGVSMLTLHTLGGARMLVETKQRLEALSEAEGILIPRLLGVTILTSLDEDDLSELGMKRGVHSSVAILADLALRSGLEGIVASPHELDLLQLEDRQELLCVIPGIRPEGTSVDDQRRSMTPGEAISKGADYLVIGRPITRAPDPLEAVRSINRQVSMARRG